MIGRSYFKIMKVWASLLLVFFLALAHSVEAQKGIATLPVLFVSNLPRIDFGSVPVGSFRDTSIELENVGCDTLWIESILVSSPFVVLDPRPLLVVTGERVSVQLRFQPSFVGADSERLHFVIKYLGVVHSIDTIPLSGIGVALETVIPNDFREGLPLMSFANPANGIVGIRYTLAHQSRVDLRLYDLVGREVSALADEEESSGPHEVVFNAQAYSAGEYICQLKTVTSQGLISSASCKVSLVR